MSAARSATVVLGKVALPCTPVRMCSRVGTTSFRAPLHAVSVQPRLIDGRGTGRSIPGQPLARLFSQSTPQHKSAKPKGAAKSKKDSGASKEGASGSSGSKDEKGRVQANPEDPFDLTDVEQAFDRLGRRHEEELKQMRSGGRFTPEVIGALLVRPEKGSSATYPLREVAQVAPKGGRTISILVSEARLVKAVQSAILNSENYNQQPQVAEDNELELLMKVEPEPTDALVKRAKEVLHRWREEVRAERHKRDVVNKKWVADKVLSTDDKRKLDKELQKVQDARMNAINNKEKEVLKLIASSQGR
ncbi:ribosome recycling factor [Thozetella sp. PMI_491]|nr:ribosome recycling factor [Thozetella sp. PMI_491]